MYLVRIRQANLKPGPEAGHGTRWARCVPPQLAHRALPAPEGHQLCGLPLTLRKPYMQLTTDHVDSTDEVLFSPEPKDAGSVCATEGGAGCAQAPPQFIVIDGLDATGKTTLARELARELGAEALKCPPQLIAPALGDGDLRTHFDTLPPPERRAYYRAANLIASEQAKLALAAGKHVVMDRYWTSTAAFSALDDSPEGAPPASPMLATEYPPELRAPDILILLTVHESQRAERLRGRGEPVTEEEQKLAHEAAGREAVLQAFRRFAPIEVDTSNLDPPGVLSAVLELLESAK